MLKKLSRLINNRPKMFVKKNFCGKSLQILSDVLAVLDENGEQ